MVLASAVHYSDRLKAAVDIVGISNFVTFLKIPKITDVILEELSMEMSVTQTWKHFFKI
jgi:hypothetical protein